MPNRVKSYDVPDAARFGGQRLLGRWAKGWSKFMALYRVTLQAEMLVDINEDNLVPDARRGFQGDRPEIAVNRAIWCLMKGDEATRKAFGIRRQNYRKKYAKAELIESASEWLVTKPDQPVA